MGYLMNPDEIDLHRTVPGADELQKVLHAGARALEWVDVLQKDLPVEQREQIWRRVDRIGREPTPEKPMKYNPNIILESYQKALAAAPASVSEALQGGGNLPSSPPSGLTSKDVVAAVRDIHVVYSRASRWLALYEWRTSISKASRDLRGWLKLNRERDSLIGEARIWTMTNLLQRQKFIEEVSEACPIATGVSVEECRRNYGPYVSNPNATQDLIAWVNDLNDKGQVVYDSKFGVQASHQGVRTSVSGSSHKIEVPTMGMNEEIFNWIQDRINESWVFKDVVDVRLFSTFWSLGAVRVEWEQGALPHVNAIAGDTITMDSNTPKWLEHTQTVMRHEFGHVLGFPDCYTEFWDDSVESFVYYSLDPSDAMCALSGSYLDRHRDALVKGYF